MSVNIRDLLRDTQYDYEDRFTEEGTHYVNLTLSNDIVFDSSNLDLDQDYVELVPETDPGRESVCEFRKSRLTLNHNEGSYFCFQLNLQTNKYEYQGILSERDPTQSVQIPIIDLFNSSFSVSWKHTYEGKGINSVLSPYAESDLSSSSFDCLPIVEPLDGQVIPFNPASPN